MCESIQMISMNNDAYTEIFGICQAGDNALMMKKHRNESYFSFESLTFALIEKEMSYCQLHE